MSLRLTATATKSFFQYRCDRQVRYAMMASKDRQSLTILERPQREAWAAFGIDYETAVVARLAEEATVLRPADREDHLSSGETLAFLSGVRTERFAHQACLSLLNDTDFRRRWGIDERVELASAYPDLIAVRLNDGRTSFRLIDVKAVHAPTLFHRTQVAYYSLLLEALLRERAVEAAVDPVAEIWHLHPEAAPGEVRWQVLEFRLKGYQAQVAVFLATDLTRIAATQVTPDRDETHFHLYFKCEQCAFLPHCERAIADDRPRQDWHVSAVTGLSQSAKRALWRNGIRTVGELAVRTDLDALPDAGWGLRTRGAMLAARAALLGGEVRRLPDRMTYRMPGRIDIGLYLLVDHDPIEARLAALAALCEQDGRRDFTVEVVTRPGAAAECDALRSVLGALAAHLHRIDAHNAIADQPNPWFAHLLVYDPSEADDLQRALGRHLDDPIVRGELLDLIRMFPPEPLQPDPEYGGRKHLPATAVRAVLDALYALPAKVSHDLRAVTAALATADPPLAEPYQPAEAFRRPFSSRLNIDACRAVKSGQLQPDAVVADVRARLSALAGLVGWVLHDNARATDRFLRLKKEPFRLQRGYNPLDDNDLDRLHAQELFGSRADELAALNALASPASERRTRFRCLGPLTLVDQTASPQYWAKVRLLFRGGDELRSTELGAHSFGVILSDGDPDRILDPDTWPALFVTIADIDPSAGRVEIDVSSRVWNLGVLPKLLATPPAVGWYIDQARLDENTPKLLNFLRHLGGE
jgi:hypothetical protein